MVCGYKRIDRIVCERILLRSICEQCWMVRDFCRVRNNVIALQSGHGATLCCVQVLLMRIEAIGTRS